MLISAQTRVLPGGSRFFDVAAGATVNEEGRALVLVDSNGVAKAQFSAGGAGEIFAGISLSHVITPSSLAKHGTATAVGVTLTLPKTPISGQIRLYNVTDGQALTLGNPTNDNEYSVSGATVTLHSGETGDNIRYDIRYTPTVDEAIQEYGEGMVGVLSDRQIAGTVGAITKGIVATTCYLVDSAWTVGAAVKTGANGFFTQGGSGTTLSNVIVRSAPSATSPYLVLELLG